MILNIYIERQVRLEGRTNNEDCTTSYCETAPRSQEVPKMSIFVNGAYSSTLVRFASNLVCNKIRSKLLHIRGWDIFRKGKRNI